MKKSKKNYAIIVLIVILLALAIGYATFTASLTIEGTVEGEADWEVIFTDVDINGDGEESEDYGTGSVSADGTTITVAVNLNYPGDACTVTATITNNGSIDAKLTGFTIDDEGLSDEVTLDCITLATDGTEIIEAGDSCVYTFVAKWNDDSVVNNILSDGSTGNFSITFDYEQNTNTVNLSPAHSEH